MQIGVPAETLAQETRIAATPETVKKLVAQGHTVGVQAGAGLAASFTDQAFSAAGAQITDAAAAWGADLILKVRAPQATELHQVKAGAVLVGMLNPFDADGLQRMAAAHLTSFALEAAPRTSRAQSMDVLSSQANIAGYKAVMMAANLYQRFFPMLMTAAGTVKAARVVILGVGVAGCKPSPPPNAWGPSSRPLMCGPVSKSKSNRWVPNSSMYPTRPAKKKKPQKAWGATPARCPQAGSNDRKPKSPSVSPKPMWSSQPP